MRFTDIFIRRPVLASVISLLILVVGIRSIFALDTRMFPKLTNTVVTVSTIYPGASSELIQGFITQPLQQAVAEADGIDFIMSTSVTGKSTIEANMRLGVDANAALADIQAKVSSKKRELPAEAEDPIIEAKVGDPTSLMYIAFYSESMSLPQITDFLVRVAQPQLQALKGVAKARPIGNKYYAARIWLNPEEMQAHNISTNEVMAALRRNNVLSSPGNLKGDNVRIDVSANTTINDINDFKNLVVVNQGDRLVRLSDVTRIELGTEDYDSMTLYRGIPSIFIGIEPAPGENPLDVAKRVHGLLPELEKQFPEGLSVALPYDASVFIQDSIDEVFGTIGEAVIIVLIVIFLTLGTFRAALIPALAVPLSLIGGAFLMLSMGFSINLLTLLAMVLAIGLVVDDAIVVVENVHRHIEEGKSKLDAAILGARELGLPIIAMTTTLVAVYAPIGFMGGLVGTLFTEFAFSLAGAVLISGVVALTLSPMVSAYVLKPSGNKGRFETAVEHFFDGLSNSYQRLLHSLLDTPAVILTFGLVILLSIYAMFITSKQELAPTEDQSILFFQAKAPQTATREYNELYVKDILAKFESVPEYDKSFILIGFRGDPSVTFGGFKMGKPNERERTQSEVQPEIQGKLAKIAGFQTAVFPRPTLPGSARGLPIQFVLTSDADLKTLDSLAGQMIGKAMKSGNFIFLRKSLDFTRPNTTIEINRDLAATMGVSMKDIGDALSGLMGENYANRFTIDGRSYKVIPQADREFLNDPDSIGRYTVRSSTGKLVPLSTLISFKHTINPSKRTQFNQMNSLTLEGIMFPTLSMGDALAYLEQLGSEVLPDNIRWDFDGQSRQFMQQGSALVTTFFLSLVIIYLVLAAQFESWRDPLIILVSVPMSIAGAMIFITTGFASINIFTQVGLITLIGLIAKNGILVVEFANQLIATKGMHKREAIEEAAKVRLRPILMTTVSMLVAMVPLLWATGPFSESRYGIGLVIITGLGIGTLFTLFVVPAVYLKISNHKA